MDWYFKIDDDLRQLEAAVSGQNDYKKKLVQKKKFSGEEGDRVVILAKDNGEWSFLYQCTITGIKLVEIPDKEDITGEAKKNEYTITLDNFKEISTPNLLEDYTYTLTRIKNYTNPIKGFRLKIGRITNKEEFNAIVNNQIFISRTIFGKLFNALHIDHQLGFVRYLINENPELFFGRKNYQLLFQELKIYVQDYIIQHSRWLTKTYQRLVELVGEEQANRIGFQLPDKYHETKNQNLFNSRGVDNIFNQVQIIEKYEKLFNGEFWVDMEDTINNSDSNEQNLNNLFGNLDLPINLDL